MDEAATRPRVLVVLHSNYAERKSQQETVLRPLRRKHGHQAVCLGAERKEWWAKSEAAKTDTKKVMVSGRLSGT